LALVALGPPCAAWAAEEVVQLEVRPGARAAVVLMPREGAVGSVVLLSGGDGGTQWSADGRPTSTNFLVRSRALFHAQGFHVVVPFRASDRRTMDNAYRTTREHLDELALFLKLARERFGGPLWLVGTSRGSVSTASAARKLPPGALDGIVLSSSVVHRVPGNVASQALDEITVPALVIHHAADACDFCPPQGARWIYDGLTKARARKLVMIEGGSDPTGDACGPMHWHGFINFEAETVRLIADWMKRPE
jgi:pimeloyl-ACP methyl ester carboxylesterase